MFVVVLLVIAILTCHIDVVASTPQEECNNIIHYWSDGKCLSVCDVIGRLCQFDCRNYLTRRYIYAKLGFWYDNNALHYTKNCPGDYCENNYYQGWQNDSQPDRNEQCNNNWSGHVCGECKKNNSIIFDSAKCVSSSKHCKLEGLLGWLLVFLVTLLYWSTFILLVVVLLNFNFDTSIGYAYGILFYYSVLETLVKQQVTSDFVLFSSNECDLSDGDIYYTYTFEATILSFLTSIGNLKPPFLQFMKLCLHTEVVDHVFFVYTHPVIVVSLLAVIAVAARKFSKLARLVQRHSSIMICLILLLSYSSISYTSVQLLKPLAVYDRIAGTTNWHFYWSPSITFAKGWRVLYIIVAVFCEAIISVGLPFLLLFKDTFLSKLNLNRLKPILDQLQGCYKDEYRWFAAFYLICRQVIYITDLASDFLPSVFFSNNEKHTTYLIIIFMIVMTQAWFQPYKIKSLNTFDSTILVILMFAIFASFSDNYVLRILLWFLPLAIFLCYMTSSTKLKHIVIPIICFIILCLSSLLLISGAMRTVAIIIAVVSLYYLIRHIREVYKSCRQRFQARNLEIHNDYDSHNEELYKRYVY